ncbi:MAG: DNA-binding protein [Nitrospirae bacterium CG_4_10_14_0_8_um_filter_41_23]|nr:MAG: DNA-binding protein [Nitrospirae bacterium CG11_big_fil_rev_8_21_14_0_20_41_14]PIY87125.1 MAG: DNA-binding protein [Nitrospirae bacterium CG_4_10_14_0_8_um_filter_41_23]PJA78887.1 MAG: DNA-binding protein [Nitrospirae bacterium CG_4_9_14_3_um_filter_41_27]
MKVYVDTSALNRIFDDQSKPRIYLEASSMLIVFMLIDSKAIKFVSSDVLLFENSMNPYEERRLFVDLCIQKASHIQPVNEGILARAQEIEALAIKGVDALHIACAEEQKADHFLTCDDKILNRYKGSIKVENPIDFVINFFKKEESNDI